MESYLHVGTNNISSYLFRQVKPGYSPYKPCGGLWLTPYDERDKYNSWVGYLSEHPHLLYYKGLDTTNIPCTLVTLKDNAHIFTLDSDEALHALQEGYGLDNSFDWQKLSNDYDALLTSFYASYYNPNLKEFFKDYCLDSLIVFKYQIISHYRSGKIETFGQYGDGYFDDYTINISDEEKTIEDVSKSFELLTEQIKKYVSTYLKTHGITNIKYNDYIKLYSEIEATITKYFKAYIEQEAKEHNISSMSLTRTLVENALI